MSTPVETAANTPAPDIDGRTQAYLLGVMSPTEQAAADTARDPAAWKRRRAVNLYLSSRFGRPISDLEHDAYRRQWFGDDSEDDTAFHAVRTSYGVPNGLLVPEDVKQPPQERRGSVDTALAKLVPEKPALFLAGAVLDDFSVPLPRALDQGRASIRASLVDQGGSAAAMTASLLGLNRAAGRIGEATGFLSEFYGPDEDTRTARREVSGKLLRELVTPAWWETTGAEGLATRANFSAAGIASYGLFRLAGLTNPAGLVLAAGASTGAMESAIEGGSVFVEGARAEANAALRVADLQAALDGLQPAERQAALDAGLYAALMEQRQQLARLGDRRLAAKYASQVFWRNVAFNMAMNAASLGMGASSFKLAAGKRFGAMAAALGLVGADQVLEQEQEQQQNTWSREALAAWVAGRTAALDLMPGKTFRALTGNDPEARDTVLAVLLQSGRSTVVEAAVQWGGIKTMVEAETARAVHLGELRTRAAAGDDAAKAELLALDTPGTTAPGTRGLAAFGNRLKGLARQAIARTHDAMEADPEAATALDAEALVDDSWTRKAEAFEAQVLEHTESIDETSDDVLADDTEEEPADVDSPAADLVSTARQTVQSLEEAYPEARHVEVIPSSAVPAGVRARNATAAPIQGYRQGDGTMAVVGDALGEDPAAEAAKAWLHEQSHAGLEAMFSDDRGALDAYLDRVASSMDAATAAAMIGTTGLSASAAGQNTARARRLAAREYLARLAETAATNPDSLSDGQRSLWQDLRELIRAAVRRLAEVAGVHLSLSESELSNLALATLRAAGVRPAASRARRTSAIPAETMPVSSFLEEQGGVVPKGRARNPGGEYDGQPDLRDMGPFAGRLYARDGGLSPDQAAAMLHERGTISDAYPDTMWEAVRAEVKAWRGERTAAMAEAQGQAQAERFAAEVRTPGARSQAVAVDSIRSGDVLTSRGEDMKAVGIDPDSGAVVLQGGERYGTQEVEAGATLYPEIYQATGEAVDDLAFRLGSYDLPPEARALAVAIADAYLRERRVGRRWVAGKLTDLGIAPDTAPTVIMAAQDLAASLRAERLDASSNRAILSALMKQGLQDQYRQEIGRTVATTADQERMIAREYRRIEAWTASRLRQRTAARHGLSDAELTAAGFADLAARLDRIVADYAPKPKDAAEPGSAGGDAQDADTYDPEGAGREGRDSGAEAAAMAPLPAQLPAEPVDVAKLKAAIVEAATAKLKAEGLAVRNANTDPVLRAEVARTWARLLRKAAREHVPAGARAEWIAVACRELELQPGTLNAINNRAGRLAYWISRAAEKSSAEVIVGRIRRKLAVKAIRRRKPGRTDIEKQEIAPATRAWLSLVSVLIDRPQATCDSMLAAVRPLPTAVESGRMTEDEARAIVVRFAPVLGADPLWRAADFEDLVHDFVRAVVDFGALKERTKAELLTVEQAVDQAILRGREEVQQRREEAKARVEDGRKAFTAAVLDHPEPAGDPGWGEKFLRSNLGLHNRLGDLIRHAAGETERQATAFVRSFRHNLQRARNTETETLQQLTRPLYDFIRQAYGRDPEAVVRDLRRPVEAFRRFDRNNPGRPKPLSRQDLMGILGQIEEQDDVEHLASEFGRDDAYLAAVRAALDPRDLQVLDWLRDKGYPAGLPFLDKATRRDTGMPLLRVPGVYYPRRPLRDERGLAEVHSSAAIMPGSIEHRVRHKLDIDERAGAIDAFLTHAGEVSRFYAMGDVHRDARNVFGNPETVRALKTALGGASASEFRHQVTQAVAMELPGDPDGLGPLRAATAAWYMAGSAGSYIRQLSGFVAFYAHDPTGPEKHPFAAMLAFATDHAAWREGLKALEESPAFAEWAKSGWSEAVSQAYQWHPQGNAAYQTARAVRLLMRLPQMGVKESCLVVAPGLYMSRRRAYEYAGDGEREAHEHALADVMLAVNSTQGTAQAENMSPFLQRHKTLLQFQGQVSNLLELELVAARRYAAQPTAARFGELVGVAAVLHVAVMLSYHLANAFWKFIRGDFEDDPDEETRKTLSVVALEVLLGPWGALAGFGDALESFFRGASGERFYGSGSPALQLLAELGYSAGDIAREVTAMDWDQARKDVLKLIERKGPAVVRDPVRAYRQWSNKDR